MGSKSRRKGFGYEREVVNMALAAGLDAKRAWGSNGEAIGESAGVDVIIAGMRMQAKRRARATSIERQMWAYLGECDAVVTREDNGRSVVMMDLERFLAFLQQRGNDESNG